MNAALLLALTLIFNAVTVAADPALSSSDEKNYQTMQKALTSQDEMNRQAISLAQIA